MKEEAAPLLDQLVLNCAAYMFENLIIDFGTPDYDIVDAAMDDKGWSVVLNAATMPERMFQFVSKTNENRMIVSTYIKAHSFYADL